MKVKDLMRTHIATLRSDDALDVAEDIMRMGRVRHLPVVDAKGWLVGILSQRDLFKASISSVLGFTQEKEHEWLGKVLVREVMTKEVTTTGPETEIIEAVDKLIANKFGCLPVIDDGKFVGLLTETDCLGCFRDFLKMGTFKDPLS